MLKGVVAGRYSSALYDLALETKAVDSVEDDLKAVVAVINENDVLKKLIYHPQITAAEKKDLLDQLFKGKVLPLTGNFLALLVDRRREVFLEDIVAEFVDHANKDRNIVEAKVSSAIELTDAERGSIDLLLAKITGKEVRSAYAVDPSLMGGVLVHIGDKVVDGTIKSRLDAIRDSLRKIS